MLLEVAVVLASIIPSMFLGAHVGFRLTRYTWIVGLIQMAFGLVIGLVALQVFTSLVWYVVIGTTIAPLIINFVSALNTRRQKQKALGGGYGDEVQWAAEMVEEEQDQEFAMAVALLPQSELREIGIIAENKEELRELTIERLDELSDDTLPKEFA